MSLIVAAHPVPFNVIQELVGSKTLPVLTDTNSHRFYLLKDSCAGFAVNYSKVRSIIQRGKLAITKLVLSGQELHQFKSIAFYETTASHLAFVDQTGFAQLLQLCGVSEAAREGLLRVEENSVSFTQVAVSPAATPTTPISSGADVPYPSPPSGSAAFTPASHPSGTVGTNAPLFEPRATRDCEMSEQSTRETSFNRSFNTEFNTGTSDAAFSDDEDTIESDLRLSRREKMTDVDDADLANGIKSVIKFKCYTLQDFEMTTLNHSEFHHLREFFSTPRPRAKGINRVRNPQTIAKSRERICGFLGWLKQSGRVKQPSFKDFHDLDLFLFLEAIRCQKKVVDSLLVDAQDSRLPAQVQKYLALAFYAAIPPSRSKEIRLLLDRILTESESRTSLQNHITLVQGRHVIVVSDYKNSLYNGTRDAIELPDDSSIILKYLTYFLQPIVRARVTSGKKHGYLFCKNNGDAFDSAGEWSAYLARIVEKHIGIANISSNALRHSFTTYMESAVESDHVRLRESTAYAMRHNIRIQQHTYNNTPSIERKRKAVDFASRVFKRIVLEDSATEADSDNGAPPLGALVGTKLLNGRPGFGKVVRIENANAIIMLLTPRQTEGATLSEYVADIGSLLRRNIAREILYPIDGVYTREQGVYEVFTSLEDVKRMLGRHVIVVSDYKNSLYNGTRDAIELPDDSSIILKYLTYFLQPIVRARVTSGKKHGYLFCKNNGDAFDSAGEWSAYLARIVEKHIGIANISSNALRHSFTTYMESAVESDHVRLRESTAYAMRHNIRIQQHTYNNTPSIERKRKAVDFASRVFKRIVLEDSATEADSDNGAPPLGALVGTKLLNGRPGFGKVVRIENANAIIMLLTPRQTEGATLSEYVADIGSLLRRNIAREILYPIDGVYTREQGVYEVFTSLEDVKRMLVR
ncbi:uncharacterized protein EV422DRAFT_570363 [Fimicolochytrium jonesii]|uniref:uncharacterized protein n=1 Tax=Fimicolochytrium jonesii TaxID=1396493 RepID=UPI0022FED129|nr:uncharacterized protein EV422DRAFT_570363 [Fimicolochytrium jonesii]KAI8817890.1 hypothetical protein EV422DRAFT_570363 [Fimicolochytrium jonesii]